jgi:hypothetical protein
MCQECLRQAAFEKGPEALAKVGGRMLCFLCTRNHKRKMRANEKQAVVKKRERPEGEHNGTGKKRSSTSSGAEPISGGAAQASSNLEPNYKALYEEKETQAQEKANEQNTR